MLGRSAVGRAHRADHIRGTKIVTIIAHDEGGRRELFGGVVERWPSSGLDGSARRACLDLPVAPRVLDDGKQVIGEVALVNDPTDALPNRSRRTRQPEKRLERLRCSTQTGDPDAA